MQKRQFTMRGTEWKRLPLLRKGLFLVVELFALGFGFIFLLGLVLIEKRDMGYLAVVFFYELLLLALTRWFIRFMKTRYLCVPVISRWLPAKQLRESIEQEVFYEVPETLESIRDFAESENWYYVDERFFSKRLICAFDWYKLRGNSSFQMMFIYLTGQKLTANMAGDEELLNYFRQSIKNEYGDINSFDYKKQLRGYAWLRKDPYKLMEVVRGTCRAVASEE